MKLRAVCSLILTSTWLLAGALTADDLQTINVPVGMTHQIEQLVLPGTDLVVKPLERTSPIVIRIIETFPHGSDTRYDLEFYGLEPGAYDLSQYLVQSDGTPAADLPAIPVMIESLLPAGQVTPHALSNTPQRALGGYAFSLIVGGVLWFVILLVIIVWVLRGFIKPRQEATEDTRIPIADRLKPLVEAAMCGELDQTQQALLERTLVMFWRDRLELHDVSATEALATLRAHDEAGQLLRLLEQWLHQPPQRRPQIDITDLLAPYQSSISPSADMRRPDKPRVAEA